MALKIATATFARSAGTTQYTAGDVVGPTTTPALMNLGACLPNAYIVGAAMTKDAASVTTATMRLWLYVGVSGPTPIADNSPWTTLYANDSTCIGFIDLGTPVSTGAGSDAAVYQNFSVSLPTFDASSAGNLWGVLEATGAYTPESGESFTVTLYSDDKR
jgi:hypothetical protein